MTDQIDTGTLDLLATMNEGVLTLTLNRPEPRNAMSEAMNKALAEQLAWAEVAPSVKCVVLTGAGMVAEVTRTWMSTGRLRRS